MPGMTPNASSVVDRKRAVPLNGALDTYDMGSVMVMVDAKLNESPVHESALLRSPVPATNGPSDRWRMAMRVRLPKFPGPVMDMKKPSCDPEPGAPTPISADCGTIPGPDAPSVELQPVLSNVPPPVNSTSAPSAASVKTRSARPHAARRSKQSWALVRNATAGLAASAWCSVLRVVRYYAAIHAPRE